MLVAPPFTLLCPSAAPCVAIIASAVCCPSSRDCALAGCTLLIGCACGHAAGLVRCCCAAASSPPFPSVPHARVVCLSCACVGGRSVCTTMLYAGLAALHILAATIATAVTGPRAVQLSHTTVCTTMLYSGLAALRILAATIATAITGPRAVQLSHTTTSFPGSTHHCHRGGMDIDNQACHRHGLCGCVCPTALVFCHCGCRGSEPGHAARSPPNDLLLNRRSPRPKAPNGDHDRVGVRPERAPPRRRRDWSRLRSERRTPSPAEEVREDARPRARCHTSS